MNRKQLIGVTVTSLVALTPLAAIGSYTALGQTTIDLAVLRSTAMSKHNTYRAKHHSPNITIDESLNDSAQTWAENLASKGVFEHSQSDNGENLYVSYTTATSIPADTLADKAVTSWYNEVSSYDYDNPGHSDTTGHFTQVVWKSSTQLGCGAARGIKTMNGTKFNAFYVVCQYSPGGNVTDQFSDNVLQP